MSNQKENKKPDYRFWTGLGLIIFLVVFNSYVKDIPVHIIAIPAILMGIDIPSILDYLKKK